MIFPSESRGPRILRLRDIVVTDRDGEQRSVPRKRFSIGVSLSKTDKTAPPFWPSTTQRRLCGQFVCG